MGPMQSFSRTVTIDAGTSSGIRQDMTVLNNDGLVGRVISATRSTANVLLVLDTESVVGGRLGSNMEIGFLRGRGVTGDRGRLDLDLVDHSVTPAKGDVVVTWGSQNGKPYVAGIPIGKVESVYSTPRELAKHAVIDPYVDFTSLDVVGVVVPRKTAGDRLVINGLGGTAMNLSRTGLVGVVILLAVILQVAVFNLFAVNGVVPNLALIVVVAASIARGPQFGAFVGLRRRACCSTSRRRPTTSPAAGPSPSCWSRSSPAGCATTPAAARSPGWPPSRCAPSWPPRSSRSAVSVLGDHALPAGEMIQVIGIALLWDVVVAPLVLPVLMSLFERTRPAELAY